jgi:hypothetical protein
MDQFAAAAGSGVTHANARIQATRVALAALEQLAMGCMFYEL